MSEWCDHGDWSHRGECAPLPAFVPSDDQIRAHWLSRTAPLGSDGLEFDERCYYALKRNARARLGMQGDDEFSRFCERSAAWVARELAENHDPGDEDRS